MTFNDYCSCKYSATLKQRKENSIVEFYKLFRFFQNLADNPLHADMNVPNQQRLNSNKRNDIKPSQKNEM